jgi:hypothetical protein
VGYMERMGFRDSPSAPSPRQESDKNGGACPAGNSHPNKGDLAFPPLQIHSSYTFSQGHGDIGAKTSGQCYLK